MELTYDDEKYSDNYSSELFRPLSHDKENLDKGMYRIKKGDIYIYYYYKNNKEANDNDKNRIKRLNVGKEWTEVWVSNDPKNEIQCIGIDKQGKKQYMYSQEHVEFVEREKFLRILKFAKKLDLINSAWEKHSNFPKYSKEKVISTILYLLKTLYLRVGKDMYARLNDSYGASSLKKKHVKIVGNNIELQFNAKSHQNVSYPITKSNIVTHIKELMKLDGKKLFMYIDADDDDKLKQVTYMDTNRYIQEHMKDVFYNKDFRTYAANYNFIRRLVRETHENNPIVDGKVDKSIVRQNIKTAVHEAASLLKHTESISKKAYIASFIVTNYKENPKIFDKYYGHHLELLLSLFEKYKKQVDY